MGRRSRSRSRGGNGLSRRTFVAGGLAATGGAGLIAGSGAFSQSQATREASIDAVDDDGALVGVAIAPSVRAGEEGATLVTITNNADRELSVTVSLSDSDDGEIGEPTATIGVGDDHTFSADVDASVEPGEGALPFGIEATGGDSLEASLVRRADVEEADDPGDPGEPTLKRSIVDLTQNTNAAFSIEYDVESTPDFDRLELDVENTTVDWISGESFVRESPDGVISYPSGGTDGGAEGHTYVFTFRVYDSNDQVVLTRSTERVAGEGDDDDGIGGPDDPRLESMTVTDESNLETNQVKFVVDYEVSNTDRFGEVAVTFDNREHSWSDRTATSSNASGAVTYPENGTQGGTSGQEYDITLRVRRESGVRVDSRTITTVADGEDPPPYSRE